MEWALDNTFKDAKIEFEDLDGLSWPNNSTPPQTAPNSPPLEPLFSPGKPSIPITIYEAGWISAPSSPACCQCGLDRPACQLHPRRLSRSRRTSEINLTFPRIEDPDPFAFVPMISGPEEQSDVRERGQTGASVTCPPSVKQTEGELRPFRLLELPPEGDLSSIGPPPGLPPPRPRFRPSQGIPFPTQV